MSIDRRVVLVDEDNQPINDANPLPTSGGGGGGAVTIADGADEALGAKADAAATTDAGTFSLIALFKRLLEKFTVQFSAPEDSVDGLTADIIDTADTEVIAAQGVGVRIYVSHVVIQNSHATVSTWVNLRDGTTNKYTIYAPSEGGGASLTFTKPLRLTANTALNVQCETTGANVRVSASGYKGA